VIRAEVVIEGDLSANAIHVPSAGPYLAEINSTGFARFVSASIGGWNVTDEYIYKPISGNVAYQDYSRVYMSRVQDDAKNIGEGFTVYRKDQDVEAGETKIIRLGGLSNTTSLHHIEGEYGLQIIKKQDDGSGYENIVYFGSTQQTISGFDISVDEIKDSNSNLRLKSSGQITASNALITGSSNIGGWLIGKDPNTGNLVLSGSGAALDGTGAALYRVGYDPAKNLVSPAEDNPVYVPPVNLLIVFDVIVPLAINPSDAVNCPSIFAPLANKIPSSLIAKFEPNLT
jgi:hypothetical protein